MEVEGPLPHFSRRPLTSSHWKDAGPKDQRAAAEAQQPSSPAPPWRGVVVVVVSRRSPMDHVPCRRPKKAQKGKNPPRLASPAFLSFPTPLSRSSIPVTTTRQTFATPYPTTIQSLTLSLTTHHSQQVGVRRAHHPISCLDGRSAQTDRQTTRETAMITLNIY